MSLIDSPKVGKLSVPLLLYADDAALISESKEGLQHSLNILEQFCHDMKLTVNLEKTKVVIFNDSRSAKGAARTTVFHYKGDPVQLVDQYTYLGIVFQRQSFNQKVGFTWKLARNHLLKAMRRAYYAMFQRTQDLKLHDPWVLCMLFNALVLPVISYGSEIWGVNHLMNEKIWDEAEKIHQTFLRQILGLRRSLNPDILLAEFGRLPLRFHWFTLIIRFLNRMVNLPDDRLLKQAFNESISLDYQGFPSWSHKVRKWINPKLQISFQFDWPKEVNEEEVLAQATKEYYQGWVLKGGSKLNSYLSLYRKVIHGEDRPENVITIRQSDFDFSPAAHLKIKSKPVRDLISKFRTSQHNLEVECGRWKDIPREERTCKCCSLALTEDESHLIFDCPLYYDIRGQFYREIFEKANTDKNIRIMFNEISVHEMGQFLKKCFQKREAFLSSLLGTDPH